MRSFHTARKEMLHSRGRGIQNTSHVDAERDCPIIQCHPQTTWLSYRDDEIVRVDALPYVDPHVIPQQLFTVWHSKLLPPLMAENIKRIRDLNPGVEVNIYDFDSCRLFIEQYFTHEVLFAWDNLIPLAFKADLWRYCILYVFGGIYLDIKFMPINGFTFDNIKTEIYVKDREDYFLNRNGIQNTFMALFPRNKYLIEAIKQIILNCHMKYYGHCSVYPTGPGLLSTVFPLHFKCNARFDIIHNNNSDEPCEVIYYNEREILKKYDGYRKEQTSVGERYGDNYSSHRVYKDISIPKLIHQTWVTTQLPPCLDETVKELKSANQEWEHHLYDDETCREFIKRYFPPVVVWAFDTLLPGTFKADLFRYCVMYIHGGVYLDIKYRPVNGFSFNEFLINKEGTFVYEKPGVIYQGFFMCKPMDQRCRKAIWKVVENVKNKNYGCCVICPTGPHLFGNLFSARDIHNISLVYTETINKIGQLSFRNNGRLILHHCERYREYQHSIYKAAGTKYWKDMWEESNIYKLENYPPPV
jgi:mannosyltransferase OCH1-like enzyme